MKKLDFFDCNCSVGSRRGESAVDLTEEMNRCGINEALVCGLSPRRVVHGFKEASEQGLKPSFYVSGFWVDNEELLVKVKDETRLHPCWALPYGFDVSGLLAWGTPEAMPNPEEFVKTMLSKGVRAARLFPRQRAPFLWWLPTVEELMNVLEKHRIPLLIDYGHFQHTERWTEWREISDLCQDHPKLPVVLIREPWSHRNIYPILSMHGNLYFEISFYFCIDGIEGLCETFGAERLLFGSGMPIYDVGTPKMLLMYSDISDEEKRLIAGNNLRRLLKEVR